MSSDIGEGIVRDSMEDFMEVKLEIFVPQEYALKIRDELAKIGVGRIGNYDHCMAMYQIQGSYRPLEGANPFEGKVGEISEGMEYKIEVNCKRELVNEAIKVIKNIHPYEEPLINIFPLANHLFETGK
jgi:hypothetical protein